MWHTWTEQTTSFVNHRWNRRKNLKKKKRKRNQNQTQRRSVTFAKWQWHRHRHRHLNCFPISTNERNATNTLSILSLTKTWRTAGGCCFRCSRRRRGSLVAASIQLRVCGMMFRSKSSNYPLAGRRRAEKYVRKIATTQRNAKTNLFIFLYFFSASRTYRKWQKNREKYSDLDLSA